MDANILVYAYVESFAQHEKARSWLDGQLSGTAPVGLPWPSLLSFLRLVTNARIFEQPAPVPSAWQQVTEWLECESAWVPHPTDRHAEVLGELLGRTGSKANLVPDAHLAALSIEHGLLLCSADGDFARFPQVRWQNPVG
ncbi:MAG: TA system VapC family ribonuclease toxin [Candidatus Binatia bacterium]